MYSKRASKKFYIDLIVLTIVSVFFLITGTTLIMANDKALDVFYFYNNPCGSCDEESAFLKLLEDKSKNGIKGITLNISMHNTFPSAPDNLFDLFDRYNVPDKDQITPVVFIGDTYISGKNQIDERIEETLNIEKSKFIETYDKKETVIIYFYVEPCPSCEKTGLFFETLEEGYVVGYNGKTVYSDLTIMKYNINEEYALDLLKAYFKEYEVLSEDQKVPIVFIGKKYLSGEDPIIGYLVGMIESAEGLDTKIIDIDEPAIDDDVENNKDIDNNTIYILYSEYCEICREAKEFLSTLTNEKEINIVSYDVNKDREKVNEIQNEYKIKNLSVPIMIYKDRVFTGFNTVVQREITNALNTGTSGRSDFLSWKFDQMPVVITTIIIGSLDGFNPCSIWALLFLISMIIRFGSRKLILAVGITYITVVSLIYGLFIFGLFGIITHIIDYLFFRILVFIIASVFAAINIYNYFTNKKEMLFSISNSNKKRFIEKIRARLYSDNSLIGYIIASAVLAVFASLIELPCTAGFPIIWNGIIADSVTGIIPYLSLLLLYLLMYVLIEILVMLFMVVTMNKVSMNITHARNLKLISGILMGYLAVLFLSGSKYLNNIIIVASGFVVILLFSLFLLFFKRRKST